MFNDNNNNKHAVGRLYALNLCFPLFYSGIHAKSCKQQNFTICTRPRFTVFGIGANSNILLFTCEGDTIKPPCFRSIVQIITF